MNVHKREEVAVIATAKAGASIAQAEVDVRPANNANAAADDTTVPKKTRTTMAERAASGYAICTQLEVRIYIKTAYIR